MNKYRDNRQVDEYHFDDNDDVILMNKQVDEQWVRCQLRNRLPGEKKSIQTFSAKLIEHILLEGI